MISPGLRGEIPFFIFVLINAYTKDTHYMRRLRIYLLLHIIFSIIFFNLEARTHDFSHRIQYRIHFSFNNKDSLFLERLRQIRPDITWNTFFLILAKTNVETYTNAPAILRQIRDIRRTQLCPYILIIWKDDGKIGEKQFKKYLERSYGLEETQFLKTFINDTLVDFIDTKFPNSMVFYFHEGKIIYAHDGKYDFFPDRPLPYNIVSLHKDSTGRISESAFLRSTLSEFLCLNDTLCLELADVHNERLRLIDLKNRKTLKVFDESRFNVTELYYRIISRYFSNLDKAAIARQIHKLNSIRRSAFRISKLYVRDSVVFIITELTSSIPAQHKIFVPVDYKEKNIAIRKGELIDEDIFLIIKTDKFLNVLDTFFLADLDQDAYMSNYLCDPTTFFDYQNGQAVLYSYKYNPRKDKTYPVFYRKNRGVRFCHKFIRDGDELKFHSVLTPKYIRDFGESYFTHNPVHIVRTKNDTYLIFSIYPEVFSVNSKRPVSSVLGAQSADLHYSFPKNLYDTLTAEIIPLRVLATKTFYDKLIFTLLKLNEKLFVNVFNNRFQLLSSVDVTNTLKDVRDKLYPDNVSISDRYLYIFDVCQGELLYYRYAIDFNSFNLHADILNN